MDQLLLITLLFNKGDRDIMGIMDHRPDISCGKMLEAMTMSKVKGSEINSTSGQAVRDR